MHNFLSQTTQLARSNVRIGTGLSIPEHAFLARTVYRAPTQFSICCAPRGTGAAVSVGDDPCFQGPQRLLREGPSSSQCRDALLGSGSQLHPVLATLSKPQPPWTLGSLGDPLAESGQPCLLGMFLQAPLL